MVSASVSLASATTRSRSMSPRLRRSGGGSIASCRARSCGSPWMASSALRVVEAGPASSRHQRVGARRDGRRAWSPRASAAGRRASARGRASSWPEAAEIGIASTRPTIVGDIQPNSDGAIMKADTPANRPKRRVHAVAAHDVARRESSRRRAAAGSSRCRGRPGSGTPRRTGSASGSAPSAPT